MKNYLFHICLLICVFFIACEPITDRMEMGSVVAESDLRIEVYTTTEGGNQIVMSNETPQVGSFWDYIVSTSVQQRDTVLLPFLGEHKITFTGLCAGGTVTTTRTVKIDRIDHALAPEWALLAGTEKEGKTWVWDNEGLIWGDGGYLYDIAPMWSGLSAEDMESKFPEDFAQSITFDLNGGANFTKKKANGTIVEKGSFSLDLSRSIPNGYNTAEWSTALIKINEATVMHGISPNEGNTTIHQFEVMLLDKDHLVLAYPEQGISPGGRCWYWKFKAQ